MYKKLLNKESKNFGGVNNFVVSLRKEVTFWKIAFLFISIAIIFNYSKDKTDKMNSTPQNPLSKFAKSDDIITTSQIKNLKESIIAEIKIEGVIMPDEKQEKLLDAISKSSNIKGLLVTINSPGGDPTASEVIYTKLKKISKKIPVISFIQGYGASGGYMVAIAGNKIISVQTGIIGSIGVIGSQFDYTELMKKLGINYIEYKTSPYKGAGTPFKTPTELQKQYKQDLVNQIFEVFTGLVKKERKLTKTQMLKVSNAKVFVGANAISVKLIDAVGDKDFALEEIKKELKKQKVKNVEAIQVKHIAQEDLGQNNFLNIKSYLKNIAIQIKSLVIK